jgi:hypothetical protein
MRRDDLINAQERTCNNGHKFRPAALPIVCPECESYYYVTRQELARGKPFAAEDVASGRAVVLDEDDPRLKKGGSR